MALFDYEMRLRSRFDCQTPQAASPLIKRLHELPRQFDARVPHVDVVACLGTAAASVDRTNVNHYNGHVPDAPVMVGREQADAYAKAVADTGWGKQRLLAMAGAAIVGAGFAVVVAGVTMGIVVGLHALNLTTACVSVDIALAVFLANLPPQMCLFAASEWFDWAAAHKEFKALQALCTGYLRRPHEGANAAHLQADNEAVREALATNVWAIHHAALELSDTVAQPMAGIHLVAS